MTFALKGVGGWVVEKCMDVREATVKGGYVKMPTGGLQNLKFLRTSFMEAPW